MCPFGTYLFGWTAPYPYPYLVTHNNTVRYNTYNCRQYSDHHQPWLSSRNTSLGHCHGAHSTHPVVKKESCLTCPYGRTLVLLRCFPGRRNRIRTNKKLTRQHISPPNPNRAHILDLYHQQYCDHHMTVTTGYTPCLAIHQARASKKQVNVMFSSNQKPQQK